MQPSRLADEQRSLSPKEAAKMVRYLVTEARAQAITLKEGVSIQFAIRFFH